MEFITHSSWQYGRNRSILQIYKSNRRAIMTLATSEVVGIAVPTVNGLKKIADATITGKSVKPKYFKVSKDDIPLDPTIEDLTGIWYQADITAYIPVDDNTVHFITDVPPEEASDYGRVVGLYFEDRTLFAISKPKYPFSPALKQRLITEFQYTNATNIMDFSYIPLIELDQYLTILDVSATLGNQILELRKELELLKLARERLFMNDREFRSRIEKLEADVYQLQQNQLALAGSIYNLASIVKKNTEELQRLITGLKL